MDQDPRPRPRSILMKLGVAGFVVGVVPLLSLIFFSPGLSSEGPWARAAFGFGVLTEIVLVASGRRVRPLWTLAVFQALLLAGVLYETLSDSRLYLGS